MQTIDAAHIFFFYSYIHIRIQRQWTHTHQRLNIYSYCFLSSFPKGVAPARNNGTGVGVAPGLLTLDPARKGDEL